MNFLETKKKCAQFRGELQNGSITGMNSDEISLMEFFINETVRELAGLHPPFLNTETRIRVQSAITLMSGGLNTLTGTLNVPIVYDTGKKLHIRDTFRLIDNGAQRRRITQVRSSGTTYYTDHALAAAATTANTWTAYRDAQPLPHYLGDIQTMYYEDGELPVTPVRTRQQFNDACRGVDTSSLPRIAGINVFTNRFGKDGAEYTFSGACTVTNNSRSIVMKNTERLYVGDVCILKTAGSTESLHTIEGVSSTSGQGTLYLDRDYAGQSASVTLYCNPREYTDWINLYPMPSSAQEIITKGWLKPHDMVYDADECMFPEYSMLPIIVGALMKDKFTMEILGPQWIAYYEEAKRVIHKTKEPSDLPKSPYGRRNASGTRTSQYPDFRALGGY